MTKRSGLTVGGATTPFRLLSAIAVILVALFGLFALAASGSILPHDQVGRAGMTVIHASVLGERARTTNESYDHPEIGWPGVGYAYDLRLHDATAQSRADSGLTSPGTAHAERGPRVQVNDFRLRLAPKGGSAGPLDGLNVIESSGRTFVSTPRGTVYDIPEGWVGRTTDNGQGIVFQEPGAVGNANSIRIMEPTAQYSDGYVRSYNDQGQPLDVNGNPGPRSTTHISHTYQGPWRGWP